MSPLFTTSAAPETNAFFATEKRLSLGLRSLMSVIRKEGHKRFFIDNCLKPSNFVEEGYLQQNNINSVGICTNTICYRDSLGMFNEIENLRKKDLRNGKIIVGGPHTLVAFNTIPGFMAYVVQGKEEKSNLRNN